MFRRAGVRRANFSAAFVEHYFGHLFPQQGREVPDLLDVLPGPADTVADAYRFQGLVVDRLCETGGLAEPGKAPPGRRIGLKVQLKTDTVLKNLRAPADVVCPLLSSWRFKSGAKFNRLQRRIQAVDLTLLLELATDDCSALVDAADKDDRAFLTPASGLGAHVAAVYPALEIAGSRFPFYAPHLPAYLSDLTSHAAIVVGEPKTAAQVARTNFADHGAVLLRESIPVAVGHGKECHGHPLLAAAKGLAVARAHCGLDVTRGMKGLLVTSGSWCRIAAYQPGTFEANFGPLGKVTATLEDAAAQV